VTDKQFFLRAKKGGTWWEIAESESEGGVALQAKMPGDGG